MYSLLLSAAYIVLYAVAPDAAEALVVAFMALLIGPAVHAEVRRARRHG